MKSFCCVFPQAKNVHLIKDVGMIPNTLGKYYNYDSYLVSCNNDDYIYIGSELCNLKLKFLSSKIPTRILKLFYFFIFNSKKIDVLMRFHLSIETIFCIFFYKLFNKKGIVYIKVDIMESDVNRYTGHYNSFLEKIIFKFYPLVLKFIDYFADVISVESKQSLMELAEYNDVYKNKLIYVPNGINVVDKEVIKKNQILTVGRIGTYQKANEILIESFKNIENKKGWVLKIVGPIEDQFKEYIQNLFNTNPELKESIFFLGNVDDRMELFNLYAESKIFCFTSRFESFGIVLPEAAYFGNYIVSTNVGVAKELIGLINYGMLINKDDVGYLTNCLEDLINNFEFKSNFEDIKNIISSNYDYKIICENLDKNLKSKFY